MQHKFCLKKYNILDRNEVKKSFATFKEKFFTEHFTFLISCRSILEPGLCIIISKNNVKKSYKRNLCRRMIKESFRANKLLLTKQALIVLAKQKVNLATRDNLWKSIGNFYKFLES